MSPEVFSVVCKYLERLGGSVNVLLGTGEPLLELEYVRELIRWSNTFGGRLTILSTGLLLNSCVVEALAKARRIMVQVTFDGFSQEDVASLQKIDLELVKKRVATASAKIPLVFNYTLHSKNIASLERVVTFAAECGVTRVFVTPLNVYEKCAHRLSGLKLNISNTDTKSTLKLIAAQGAAVGVDVRLPKLTHKK